LCTLTASDDEVEKDLEERGIGRSDREARLSVDNITQVEDEKW